MDSDPTDDEAAPRFRITDQGGLDRILEELALRLAGRESGQLGLVGIRRRGVPLAEGIATRLRGLGREVTVGEIGLKRYDDDLTLLHDEPRLDEEPLPFDPRGSRIVLVDDVLFSGRTLFTATAHFVREGVDSVTALVICARGEPELPVTVQDVGLHLDVGSGGIVDVHVPPYEEEGGIWLRHRPEEGTP